MKLSRALACIAPTCALVLLPACPGLESRPQEPYESMLQAESFGDFSRFPLQAAGYARDKGIQYDLGTGSSWIAYERTDAELQNAVTLYSYPRLRDAAAEVAATERVVMQLHPGTRLASQKTVELVKRGKTHQALVATFELEDTFQGERQPLASQVLVIELPGRFFKARSTAPLDQAALAEESLLRLLAELRWDEDA